MGILVRHLPSKQIFFYLKGADMIMKNKVPEYQKGFIMDECEQMAREGLRTLVIAQKHVTEAQYTEWNKDYINASQSLQNRREKTKLVN